MSSSQRLLVKHFILMDLECMHSLEGTKPLIVTNSLKVIVCICHFNWLQSGFGAQIMGQIGCLGLLIVINPHLPNLMLYLVRLLIFCTYKIIISRLLDNWSICLTQNKNLEDRMIIMLHSVFVTRVSSRLLKDLGFQTSSWIL